MTITSIQRDFGPNVSIVRIVTDSFLEDIVATGWLETQEESIEISNNGPFEWSKNDVLLISYPQNQTNPINGVQSKAFFYIFPDFKSVNPIAPIYPNLQRITAHAGGGQTDASQLNIGINVVDTVISSGDSVKLPFDVLDQTCIVINVGANPISVYPSLGDNILGQATNAPVTLNNLHGGLFIGFEKNSWAEFPTV